MSTFLAGIYFLGWDELRRVRHREISLVVPFPRHNFCSLSRKVGILNFEMCVSFCYLLPRNALCGKFLNESVKSKWNSIKYCTCSLKNANFSLCVFICHTCHHFLQIVHTESSLMVLLEHPDFFVTLRYDTSTFLLTSAAELLMWKFSERN